MRSQFAEEAFKELATFEAAKNANDPMKDPLLKISPDSRQYKNAIN